MVLATILEDLTQPGNLLKGIARLQSANVMHDHTVRIYHALDEARSASVLDPGRLLVPQDPDLDRERPPGKPAERDTRRGEDEGEYVWHPYVRRADPARYVTGAWQVTVTIEEALVWFHCDQMTYLS